MEREQNTRTPRRELCFEDAQGPQPQPNPFVPQDVPVPDSPAPDTAQATAQEAEPGAEAGANVEKEDPKQGMEVGQDSDEAEGGAEEARQAYSERRERAKAKMEKARKKKVQAETDSKYDTPKRPSPGEEEEEEEDGAESQGSERGRKSVKKLQRRVKKKEGAISDRVDKVENLLDATRDEARRQSSARVAAQQRADDAHKYELMKILTVWGLPKEARYPDQMKWYEAAASPTRTARPLGR